MSQIIPKQFKDNIKITDIGDFDHGLMDKKLELCFSNQGARTPQGEWQPQTLTVKALIDQFKNFEIGPKDGRALLQGVGQDGHRSKDKMLHADILMLDFDAGYPIVTVVEQIKERGFAALIYTTHSHGARSTTLKQKAIKKALGGGPGNDLDGVKHYLSKEKQWCPDLVNTIRIETVTDEDIHITHAPMPKFRAIFFLKERYHFNALSNVKMSRQELWSNRYKAFAETFGIPFDASCSDPSRLMYTPRRPEQAEGHELIKIGGAPLDFNAIKLPERGKKFPQNKSKPKKQLLTKGLERFLGQNSDRFEVLNWIEELDPDLIRHDKKDGSAEIECPFDDNHSNPGDHDDRACWVMNASVSESGHYQFKCLHNSCEDRTPVEFVDTLCDRCEVPIESLKQHLSERVVGPNGETEAETWARIKKLSNKSSSEEIEEILYLIAGFPSELEQQSALKEIKTETKFTIASLEKQLKKAAKSREDAQRTLEHGDDRACVQSTMDFSCQVEIALEALKDSNDTDPKIFRLDGNRTVRLHKECSGIELVPLSTNMLSAEISSILKFERMNAAGDRKYVSPFKDIIDHLDGLTPAPFPLLKRVALTPIFATDGRLQTEQGYDPNTKCFISFPHELRPLNPKPTDKEISEAKEWLYEALEGFPFSDKFDGSENLPLKNEGETNLARGESSRAAAIALILTQFMRDMIDGPVPPFVFDKPKAGTGAGFLANTTQIITTGEPAIATPVGGEKEELRKLITSCLLSGSNYIFLDNINHHIDSGPLASVLTAHVWSDRILGASEVTKIKVNQTFILAANNGSFSPELMRRMVPIRLDAGMSDPTKRTDYKHPDLNDWLLNSRADLVWSCLTLIQNWIAKGCPNGQAQKASYEDWSKKLSGVLECAGISGLLENTKHYLSTRNTEEDIGQSLVIFWHRKYGNQPVTAAQLVDEIIDKCNIALPIYHNEEVQRARLVSCYIKENIEGNTFDDIPPKGPVNCINRSIINEDPNEPRKTVRCVVGKNRGGSKTWYLNEV